MKNSIAGRVVDANGRGLKDVEILQMGKIVGRTNLEGSFSIRNKTENFRAAFTFRARGFVTNTRVFDTTSDGFFGVVLWPIANTLKFDVEKGVDVEFNGSRIHVPENALVDERGRAATGKALLSFTLLDITDPRQQLACSGDFFGSLSDGSVTKLRSFGVFDLNISSEKNKSLTLKKEIELEIKVPRAVAPNSPEIIPFFVFDVQSGLWDQISTFNWSPDQLTYNGTTNSLGGTFNLDDPLNTVCVKVQVKNISTNSPVPNAWVSYVGGQYNGTGTTNTNGFVCLLVEKNQSFSATALATIGTSNYATPFPLVVTAPNITSTASDCGNDLLCPFVGTIFVDLVVGFP